MPGLFYSLALRTFNCLETRTLLLRWCLPCSCMLSNNLPTMSININQVTGLPKLALLPDMSYLAPDCFHPSQKLHAKSKHQILLFFAKIFKK